MLALLALLAACSAPTAAPTARPLSASPTRIDYSCFPNSVFTAEEMRRRVDCHPKDYRLEISQDTVALFAFPDPMLDWVGPIFIIHVLSVSELVVNTDGSIISQSYKSTDGQAAIERVLNDSELMARILKRASEIKRGS